MQAAGLQSKAGVQVAVLVMQVAVVRARSALTINQAYKPEGGMSIVSEVAQQNMHKL